MITEFKIYEQSSYSLKRVFEKIKINKEIPKVGDYILMQINTKDLLYSDELNNFINNTYGVVYKIYDDNKNIRVLYKNIPERCIPWFAAGHMGEETTKTRIFSIDNINEFAKTKEELDLKLSMKKFNI